MLNEKTAKTILTEGKKVLITTEALKEMGVILEKKDKPRGVSNVHTIYKVKTVSGQTKWVSAASLETVDTALLGEATGLGVAWPKIVLPPAYRDLLTEEKNAMRSYKEPPSGRMSAEEVFNLFYDVQAEQRPHCVEEIKEAVKGFKEMFLYSVHTCILYKEERAYYEEYLYPATSKILQTYSLTHILRMLLIIRRIMPTLNLTKEHAEYIGEYIKLFIVFLQTHQESLEEQ
ncbi:hypothetical protein NEMIN01_1854 [Nematocida minor]|uniref:uncharacterized protein n=1 Tax=Nematocida minor TaxID=1912983 RepID=UPI00222016CD|nr:uncharacterized protein NEMIN01_1854 [Nematocida minor]KAI5192161.1 hypothetical protein NEMIN01_1854 [Nematocida minor]